MTIAAPKHPPGSFTAIHLSTHAELTFTSSPREAVLAAYAHEIGDGNTWDYEKNYGRHVRETAYGWNLNNWWCRDPAKDGTKKPKTPFIVRREVSSKGACREDKALIAPNEDHITLTIYDVCEEGFCRNERGRPLKEIIRDLNKALIKMKWPEDQEGGGDYGGFSFQCDWNKPEEKTLWPAEWSWIAVFAVTGGSEGHYVHIEIIHRNGGRQLVGLFKTFNGRGHAQLVAARTAALLGV